MPLDLEFTMDDTPALDALQKRITELEQTARLLNQQMTHTDYLIALLQAEGRKLMAENKELRERLAQRR